MQACSSSGSGCGEEIEGAQTAPVATAHPPGSVRPSPLGSYSPVRLQRASSSGTCSTCTPSPKPPQSPSCLLSAGQHTPQTARPGTGSGPLPLTPPPPSLGVKRGVVPPTLPIVPGHCYRGSSSSLPTVQSDTLSPLGFHESGKPDACIALGVRTHNGGHTGKPLQQSHTDLLPDYFSLTERPPEEFCLSPDASTSSSSCSYSQSQISVDLTQKRGLVKAVNTAVDLIVAHFGTSRDTDVKAKLGNTWVSPNVGHLVLKYLCPAIHDVLQDGLKAYVLDLIVGQCRCKPWSLVEASTQLGPSTRVLHSLFSKVRQFSELTSHRMRLNAFIFGLLNLKSLEFWFNHLYTHEDIIAAYYHPWGLLPLSQGACQPLFEELLLLLQPLSALPLDLDLLFEPRLLQKGQEQLRRKEQLCSAGQSAERTSRSTFQLMRGWSTTVSEMVRDSHGDRRKESTGLRREGTWPRMEVTGVKSLIQKEEVQRGRGRDGQREEEDRWKDREVTDKQAGWWYQLMQSSQVYIDQSTEGSKFVKTEKRRRSSERRQQPPTREGVVEGAESSSRKSSSSSADSAGRSSWMGSPPDSVLSQECSSGAEEQSTSQGQSLCWGRLFGSSLASPQKTEPKPKPQKSRAPSGWLGLDRSVFSLVAQTIGAGSGKRPDPPAQPCPPPSVTPPEAPTCEVRALCHHIATEPGHLSFNKGDVLRVLGKADPEWLMCSLDSCQGLVPIIYVTLTSMEERRELEQ